MYPSFEVDEIYEKQNAPEGDFLIYKTLRCSHHLSPCVIKENIMLYIYIY